MGRLCHFILFSKLWLTHEMTKTCPDQGWRVASGAYNSGNYGRWNYISRNYGLISEYYGFSGTVVEWFYYIIVIGLSYECSSPTSAVLMLLNLKMFIKNISIWHKLRWLSKISLFYLSRLSSLKIAYINHIFNPLTQSDLKFVKKLANRKQKIMRLNI